MYIDPYNGTSIFHLLEIIYASAAACGIQNICHKLCYGCKVYQQDCLMMTEKGWEIHGLTAIKQVNTQFRIKIN